MITVGDLIKELEKYPEQLDVEFKAEIFESYRTLLRIKNIEFNPDDCIREEHLHLEIKLSAP